MKCFHEWRRKIGAVTLVLAMVLVFWWVRSLFITDVLCMREKNRFLEAYLFDIINFFSSDYVNVFASDGSSLLWLRRKDRNPFEPFYSRYEASGDVLEHMIPQMDVSNPVVVYVPYPAIVVPLILISVWLLLSKPIPLTQRKIDKITPEKDA
jgi:hypothetical protein